MQTVKTALVVTFLLAVLYVVYTALNKPEVASDPAGLADSTNWAGPEVELPDFASAGPGPGGVDSSATSSPPIPAYAPSAGSNYPLPDFAGPSTSAPSVPADTAEAYTQEFSAPPLTTAEESAVAEEHGDHQHEHEHPSNETDEPAEAASPYEAAPYGASAYANSRSETVVGSEQESPENEAPSVYSPYSGNAAEPREADDDAASRRSLAEYRFREAWGTAQRQLDENKFARALATLTDMYREKDLSVEHRRQLLDMLDRLAGTVIYSTEHRLEPPYEVNRGETLEQISQQFQVPSELLFNINRSSINEPDLLLPGTQLKVMRGPFRAEIEADSLDPTQGEATLFLGRLYAGRFPVTFGDDAPTLGREYQVTERIAGKPYYQPSGPPLEPRSPTNPYGNYFVGLNDPVVGIHALGSQLGEEDPRGSIRLRERDAADVFGILSVGSLVKVLE